MLTIETNTVALAPNPAGKRRQLLTPIPGRPGEFLLVLDNSSLDGFMRCPRYSQHYLVAEREARVKSAALSFGGAVHAGLESFERGESVESQNLAIVNHFVENPPPQADYRTPEVAMEVLRHYRTRSTFPDFADLEIQKDTAGNPLVEVPFELPLGTVDVQDYVVAPWLTEREVFEVQGSHTFAFRNGVYAPFVKTIHFAWSGRIDLVAFSHNAMRVIDHKTTSIMGDQFSTPFVLSNQTRGYVWAARQLWPHLNISGFCVNAIHLKRPTTGRLPDDLLAPGPRGGPPALSFHRFYFDYSPESLASWETNVRDILSDFVHCLVRDYFPMHTRACVDKFGTCPYHAVCCESDPAMQRVLLDSELFQPVTWNPVR